MSEHVTLYLHSSLKWADGDEARVQNSYKKGRNPANLRRIKQLEQQIERVKEETERKLSQLTDQIELERRKCNHRDCQGNGVMTGYDYLCCPICYYSA